MKTRFYYRRAKGNLFGLVWGWLMKAVKKEENSQEK